MNKRIVSSLLIAIVLIQPVFAQQQQKRRLFGKESSIKTDTVALGKTVLKELVQELPAEKNAVIKIVNTTCNLDIRPWPEDKVKMVTTVYVDEKKAAKITPEEMMSDAGIIFKSFGNRVDIQTRTSFGGEQSGRLFRTIGSTNSAPNGLFSYTPIDVTESAFKSNQSVRWNTTGSITRQMILYIPEGCRLDVDNKNTGIIINDDINDARFKLSRSNLDARNFKKVYITADYYTINISNVEEAELELENGSFTAGIIQTLDLDSKGSEIDYENGTSLYLRSQNDRITVDQISKVAGRKLYGDLRIGKLITDLDIEGLNADIKIRSISPLTEKVKIVDQYADLRLPVKNVTNYTVLFKGEKSTVFTPFEKVVIPDPAEGKDDLKAKLEPGTTKKTQEKQLNLERRDIDAMSVAERQQYLVALAKKEDELFRKVPPLGERAPAQFKASNGDISGKHTKFDITCNQCSVDFK